MKIPIYKPFTSKKSIEYAKDAIDSGWISSIGKYVDLATEKLKQLTGIKYVVLVNNGTSATHLCVRALKKRHPETKRIIVPSSCYVAAYNSLLYDANNWTIKAEDLDLNTWNMDISKIQNGDALMAVHNLGNIIPLDNIKCPIIEDSCETLFAESKQKQSLCSSLSFFGNKNITSGEGGAVLTDDEDVFNYVSKLKGQGQTEKKYIHDELGYNYRITNIQAALLLGQLEEWDNIYKRKKDLFEKYNETFKDYEKIIPQQVTYDHSCWMYGIRIVGSKSYQDNKQFFDCHNIDTRPMFYPFTKHKHLNINGKVKNSEALSREVVIIPSYPDLTQEQQEYICKYVIHLSKNL